MKATDEDLRPDAKWAVGIPLLSRRIAKDWGRATVLLERSLRSLAAQTRPCSKVWIACHERPDLAIPPGLDVRFLEVEFSPPRFTIELEVDKLRKLEVIGAAHRAHGAGLLYLLDADDLVAQTFSERILASPVKAILIAKGYRLDSQTGNLTVLPKFWRRCGSSAIVNWEESDLPLSALGDQGSTYRQFLDTRHFAWHEFISVRAWALDIVTTPEVMYVVNHGQNDSELLSRFSWRWRLYNKLWPGKQISKEVASRFALEFTQVRFSGRDGAGFSVGDQQ